ncbi:hypothetical protein CC79DRAFT_1363133 [Sarocladium strictum]
MDLTPPSLTTSPASPQDKGFDSPPLPSSTLGGPDCSAASYPSPDLLDYPFKTVSPYLTNESLPVLRDVWNSPDSMASNTNVSMGPTMANVLPASDYDHFSNYDPSLTTPFALGESYSAPPPASSSANILRATPPVSRPASAATTSTTMESRGSFSYLSGHLLPASKLDSLPTYAPPLEAHHFSSAGVPPMAFTSNDNAFSNSPQPFFGDGSLSLWPKEELRPAPAEPSTPVQAATATSAQPSDSARNIRKTASRQQRRPPRKHTTREEANFQCTVKGCGKFFSRSYNFKSHMDTHDERREYPFPCPLDGCTKKFVRKTDLQRHHQSVHMKERNHKCDFCGRPFARKDTLRRHMEDGCSKRFDLGTMDLRAENASGIGSAKRQYGK